MPARQQHFDNDEFRDLYNKSQQELDTDKRVAMIKEAAALMREEAPCLFLTRDDIPSAFTKDIATLPTAYDRSIHLWKVEKEV